MGESKLKKAKHEEMLMTCAGVQTVAGRVQVRWESKSAATPMGQLAYFIEFLTLTGLWSRWHEICRQTRDQAQQSGGQSRPQDHPVKIALLEATPLKLGMTVDVRITPAAK